MDRLCKCPTKVNNLQEMCKNCMDDYLEEKHCFNIPPKPETVGGVKHDQGKPDFSYLSYELCEAVARVREFGAKKYSRDNWKQGFKVTRSIAAAMRHLVAFANGETNDPESGLCHLGHAVCGIEHAIYDMKHRPENDDRGGE